jgi:hypothetical protein
MMSFASQHQEQSMDTCQGNDPQVSATTTPIAPIVLDEEALRQVAGGIGIADPGWLTAPSGQPSSTILPDPGW